jgi:hypothetical protein
MGSNLLNLVNFTESSLSLILVPTVWSAIVGGGGDCPPPDPHKQHCRSRLYMINLKPYS